MKFINILDCDIIDGEGVRVTLFVSGCSHKCKGCHNPESWNSDFGKEYNQDVENQLINLLNKPYIDGITLSGGDPLYIDNRETILNLCKRIKKELPNKSIWLYTGFDFEDIETLELLNYVDVLIDGKFKLDLLDTTLAFKGSSNQRVIDVKKSLKENKVVLYKVGD